MAVGSGIVTGVGKVWLYPTIALAVVGAPALAAGWSQVFSSGLATGAGVVVSDVGNLAPAFQEGQRIGGGTATEPAPEPAEPAPAG